LPASENRGIHYKSSKILEDQNLRLSNQSRFRKSESDELARGCGLRVMNLHSPETFRTKSGRISAAVLVKSLVNVIVVSIILLNSSG
jgi:hypothetical protein